ncbi:MAG TPA: hypothetical protein VEH07_04375, partial [Alphaproteobacteria bacterium]|nr:hypothetical protein [Alphaproteobacteria bacterium]
MRASAPAKINLFLHILGRRPNGYHEMQSLVVFSAFGDEIGAELADDLSLTVSGSRAAALAGVRGDDNLIMRAAKLLRERVAPLEFRFKAPPDAPIGIAQMIVDRGIVGFELNRVLEVIDRSLIIP